MPSLTPDRLMPGDEIARLRDVTTMAERVATLTFAGGRVAGIDAAHDVSDTDLAGADVAAAGWMLLPPLADVHAHIDKAYTWESAGRPTGSLEDAVACWAGFGATLAYDRIKRNARRALTAAMRAGVTAVRSHGNYHEGVDRLRGLRALVELRAEFRGLVDLQVVAMHGSNCGDELIREAVELGVDLLGSAPHLSEDPRLEMARVVRLAEEAGIGVDIHADETLDPDSLGLQHLAELTASWPAGRTRDAGHCVSLAMQPEARLTEVLHTVAAAGVGIVTNPLTNLYLQGWEHPVAMPRGIPPLAAIRRSGVALAAGGDNVQDPFNPLGNGDMVDVVAALVLAGHLTPAEAWETASTDGRAMMGLPPAQGEAGDLADGVLVRAGTTAEAIAERAPDRVVIRGGRVIAYRRTQTASLDGAAPDIATTVRNEREMAV